MKELETSFKEYIEEVKKLSTEDKREELLLDEHVELGRCLVLPE